ncbi:MAG: hypothetical protein IKE42_21575 [Aquamicrobium sp.]|nr:hypothetical protein [Aquamicrobium sp.]
MTVSDDSTTLSCAVRRRLAETALPFGVSEQEDVSRKVPQDEQVFRLCEQWHEAHDDTLELCRKQQLLESQLVSMVGFPIGDDNAHGTDAIADRASHQARWDAMDKQIGYSAMDKLIRQSEAAEQALLGDLLLSQASTVDGVMAKLSVILCVAEHRESSDDFPWPHIRALRHDLAHL